MTDQPTNLQPAPPQIVGPVLTPWTGTGRESCWVSDAVRYKQYGNAVCVPVVAEAAAALTGAEPETGPPIEVPNVLKAPLHR